MTKCQGLRDEKIICTLTGVRAKVKSEETWTDFAKEMESRLQTPDVTDAADVRGEISFLVISFRSKIIFRAFLITEVIRCHCQKYEKNLEH